MQEGLKGGTGNGQKTARPCQASRNLFLFSEKYFEGSVNPSTQGNVMARWENKASGQLPKGKRIYSNHRKDSK